MNSLNEQASLEVTKHFKALMRDFRGNSTSEEISLLKEAIEFFKAHPAITFSDVGEKKLIKAISIARIVAGEIGLSSTGVIATLYSEFIDESDFSLQELTEKFGDKIGEIASGLVKIAEIKTDKSNTQSENLRKLILTLSKDVRVILIKIAERLYFMRNLHLLSEEEQIGIVSSTSYIYSPLAHRLGLYNIMSELEDISMSVIEPEAYHDIESKLQVTKLKRNKFIKEFIDPLEKEMSALGIKADIKGRSKSISSIWRKMKKQKVDFEEVYDKFAIRIIVDSPPEREKFDCWRVYSVVTDIYKPNPERLRDWLSIPKSNGYESLHTTVIVPGGEWVEVQIRSLRMNEIAEKGFAAHWKYKGIQGEQGIDEWLAKVRDLLENPDDDALHLLGDLKMGFDTKEIFVFTPDGDLKKFPEGATVLDFAFDIHSAVGSSCIGAKLNGRNVPIRYALKNGDKVEILRSKNQKPNVDWLNFVVTSKAKSKIKLALKEQKLKEAENGKEILKRRFRNWKLEFNDPLVRKLLKHFKLNDAIEMYYGIATGDFDLLEIKDVLFAEEEKTDAGKAVPIEMEVVEKIIRTAQSDQDDYLIIDEKLSGVDYKLGKCCNPIFGDSIFGFVTVSSGITIHRLNCPNAHQLISRYGYRIVKARWTSSEKERQFLATLKVSGIDDLGIISNITEVISKDLRVKMRSFQMDSGDGLFEGTIFLYVRDTSHLQVLVRKLTKVKGVISVQRLD